MSVWKESYNNIERNYEYNEKLIILDWLISKKEAEKYKKIYNNLDWVLKEKILLITISWLTWNYLWKLEKKHAQAILLKNAIDLVKSINFYKHKLYIENKKDIILWRNICWLYAMLLRLYPWVINAFTKEEEEEIIKMWDYEKNEQKNGN